MTSSDTSQFVKSESYYIIILTDRNENGFNPTSAYISLTLSRRLDNDIDNILNIILVCHYLEESF